MRKTSKPPNHFTPPEVEEFANRVGDFIEYWGFKHVEGRIWAHLYLTMEPMDASEIMRRLNISKGLVSISLKEMLSYAVVEVVGKSERGTILYRANPDQESVILNVIRKRERVLVSRVSSALKLVQAMSTQEKDRLKITPESLGRTESLLTGCETLMDMVLHSEGNEPRLWKALIDCFELALKTKTAGTTEPGEKATSAAE